MTAALSCTQRSDHGQEEDFPAARAGQGQAPGPRTGSGPDGGPGPSHHRFQFDNQNPSAAVTAYENALRLKPGNANVLTDLGIMYRELHRFEDALKAFREAERVQPGHRNALFNQGIVLYYDLKRKDEAEAAWRKLLAADPNAHAPDGTPVSELIKHLH